MSSWKNLREWLRREKKPHQCFGDAPFFGWKKTWGSRLCVESLWTESKNIFRFEGHTGSHEALFLIERLRDETHKIFEICQWSDPVSALLYFSLCCQGWDLWTRKNCWSRDRGKTSSRQDKFGFQGTSNRLGSTTLNMNMFQGTGGEKNNLTNGFFEWRGRGVTQLLEAGVTCPYLGEISHDKVTLRLFWRLSLENSAKSKAHFHRLVLKEPLK